MVDEQVKDLGVQMEALDDFVTRARTENAGHHDKHVTSMQGLSSTVEHSYSSISSHFKTTFDRVRTLGEDMDAEAADLLQEGIEPLGETVCQPLANLREEVAATSLQEYQPTGDTPEKAAYHFPTSLPRTALHEVLIADLHEAPTPSREVTTSTSAGPVIFADLDHPNLLRSPAARPSAAAGRASTARASTLSLVPAGNTEQRHPLAMSLREVNPNTANLTTGSIMMFDPSASTMSLSGAGAGASSSAGREENLTLPLFKRSTRSRGAKKQGMAVVEGRENVPPGVFTQSTSRRKSPRLH